MGAWFFKTGPGEYGEGDRFIGIRVPVLRKLVKDYDDLPLPTVVALLHSPWHEARLLALLILVRHYQRGTPTIREQIYRTYLREKDRVNNWDLVDSSAHLIVGEHLRARLPGPIPLLTRLARSRHLWSRRIAIIATLAFIRQGDHHETLRLAELLRDDPHDLIHKAVGWMLREVGQRDAAALRSFLDVHAAVMPRTMLRYAIEKMSPARRAAYLKAGRQVPSGRSRRARARSSASRSLGSSPRSVGS